LVHHMELLGCQNPGYDVDLLYEGDCNDPRKPVEAHGCSTVIAAWAMGAGPVIYPREAGMPFGGREFYPFVMLEVHYNNVERVAGMLDRSGFTISYTGQLRQYDAAVMELGLIYGDANSIPPHQKAFPLTGHCVADCTKKLPADGINVFASQLHAHLYGRKLWTSHFRDGVKIGEINRDNHYSPHWQRIENLRKIIKIMPVSGSLL
uniref:Dopamine beta-hydroxylase n=1 Tax=Gongylonema pulchrum TaxID=637853 RepID=A0A183EGL3_9BILA